MPFHEELKSNTRHILKKSCLSEAKLFLRTTFSVARQNFTGKIQLFQEKLCLYSLFVFKLIMQICGIDLFFACELSVM